VTGQTQYAEWKLNKIQKAMNFNPAGVLLMAFAILFKIPSVHCAIVSATYKKMNEIF